MRRRECLSRTLRIRPLIWLRRFQNCSPIQGVARNWGGRAERVSNRTTMRSARQRPTAICLLISADGERELHFGAGAGVHMDFAAELIGKGMNQPQPECFR